MSAKKTYLNQELIRKTRSKAKFQMIFGISLLCFHSLGFLCVYEGTLPKMYIPLTVTLLVPFIYLIWCAAIHYSFISKAEAYDKIFIKDKDGIITASEMGNVLNKEYFDIFVELEKIFRRGYFVNCTLQQGRNPSVIINNAQVGDPKGVGFMQMICPKCGASTRIRANSRGKCEYCGSTISAPRITSK